MCVCVRARARICVCMILEDFNTEIRWYPKETRGEKYFLAEKPGAKTKKVIAENRILNNWGHAADSEWKIMCQLLLFLWNVANLYFAMFFLAFKTTKVWLKTEYWIIGHVGCRFLMENWFANCFFFFGNAASSMFSFMVFWKLQSVIWIVNIYPSKGHDLGFA